MTDLAAFTNRPQCLKCGTDIFLWRFVSTGFHMEHAGGCEASRTIGDKEGEHLDLTCRNCGWLFGMQAKDAK